MAKSEFSKNLDKFKISTRDNSVTSYPRDSLLRGSGFYDDENISEEKKEFVFNKTLEEDSEENERNFTIRSNLMDRFTEDNSASGIIKRKETKDMSFEAYNNSLRSQGKPEVTREEFESGFHVRDRKTGLEYITNKNKIRPPKPKLTDRIRTVEAKNGYSGIVKKRTKFVAGEKGAEFVEVIPLQNKDRPVMDLGLNLGFKLGKNTRKQKVVDFDFFNGKKTKQSTRNNKTDFNFFEVF